VGENIELPAALAGGQKTGFRAGFSQNMNISTKIPVQSCFALMVWLKPLCMIFPGPLSKASGNSAKASGN